MDIQEILRLHELWLKGEAAGKRANLSYTNLRNTSLRNVNLRDAIFSHADLSDADLSYARICYANFTQANLCRANFNRTDLSDANLRNAHICYANFTQANLSGADLSGVDLNGVVGNMREIKSLQVEKYPVAWVQPPDDDTILQIGCQQYPLSAWKHGRVDIPLLDSVREAWPRLSPILFQLIEASPAVPYGKANV